MDKYIIIPGCSDLNRGDQALVWETKRLAEEAGYVGKYYLTSEKNEPVEQSVSKGISIISPILEHPSRKFKNKENIHYTKSLKIKWGIVSLFDCFGSMMLLFGPTRGLAFCMLSKDKKKSFIYMKSAKAVFMKGGGLLQTYGGLASTYSMYFWVYPILLAHKLNVPVYVMPNSFGPFKGPFVKLIAKKALKGCKLVTSRETLSQNMVKKQLGMKIDNYADLAFQLKKTNLNKAEVYKRFDLPTDRKMVAITMRPYRFPGSDNPDKAYDYFKCEMRNFIEWLYTAGYMPVIVEHTLAVNAHENDGACIKDVVEKLPKDQYRLISDKNYDCHDLKCIYGYCDYIVGTRFHSVIFSLGCNVPGIAIAYTGNKSQGIMHDVGLDEYCVDIQDVNCQCLKKKFEKLVENRKPVLAKVKKYIERSNDDYNNLLAALKDR